MTADECAPTSAFAVRARTAFDEAVARGLPVFLTRARNSTPLSATPYLCGRAEFRTVADAWIGRGALVDALDAVVRSARSLGLSIEAVLVGGSFTELQKPEIDDIDCLVFYAVRPGTSAAIESLSKLQHEARKQRVDARFVPLDSDPLALIKLVSYFTILYSKHKDHNEIVRSLLLVDYRT